MLCTAAVLPGLASSVWRHRQLRRAVGVAVSGLQIEQGPESAVPLRSAPEEGLESGRCCSCPGPESLGAGNFDTVVVAGQMAQTVAMVAQSALMVGRKTAAARVRWCFRRLD